MVMANYLAPEDDPVNYLPARINPNLAAQGRRYNLAERQQTSPLMQAGNVQFAKELSSMGNRGSVTDLINRGLIANTAGLPVDMLNTVLQTLGLGSEQPLGGSDSIRRALEYYGLSSETQRPMLETLASLTPPRAVMGAARFAGQGAGAVGRAAAEIANAEMAGRAGLSGQGGAITYHGSPHRFPPTANNPLGEFDASKIGTGEGAQAYGHGLYLAEAKGTAKTYNPNPGIASAAWDTSMKYWTDKLARNDNPVVAAKEIAILKEKIANQTGSLYKVDLPDEQIAKMLDYDKPLSKQSKEVQDALARATSNSSETGKNIPRWSGVVPANYEARSHLGTTILVDPKTGMAVHPNATHPGGEAEALRTVGDKGSVYLDELRVALGGEKNVAEFLRKNGIPGIKYLDAGSRAGGGTSNFVVFDPKHMNIIGRE